MSDFCGHDAEANAALSGVCVGGDAEITTIFTVCSQGRRCEEERTEARTRTDWVRLFLFTTETFDLVSNEMLRFGFAYLDKFVAFGLLNR